MPFHFNPIELMRSILRWLGGIDHILPLVSLHLFSSCLCLLMFWGNKGWCVANAHPSQWRGVMVERQWIDERGNPSSYCVLTWFSRPPFGAEELQGGGENQTLRGQNSLIL